MITLSNNVDIEYGLEDLVKEKRRIDLVFDLTVLEKQRLCEHKSLIECNYLPVSDGHSHPPKKMCCNCGMTEEGWGAGYQVLCGNPVPASRDDIYKLGRGLSITSYNNQVLFKQGGSVKTMLDEEIAKRVRRG